MFSYISNSSTWIFNLTYGLTGLLVQYAYNSVSTNFTIHATSMNFQKLLGYSQVEEERITLKQFGKILIMSEKNVDNNLSHCISFISQLYPNSSNSLEESFKQFFANPKMAAYVTSNLTPFKNLHFHILGEQDLLHSIITSTLYDINTKISIITGLYNLGMDIAAPNYYSQECYNPVISAAKATKLDIIELLIELGGDCILNEIRWCDISALSDRNELNQTTYLKLQDKIDLYFNTFEPTLINANTDKSFRQMLEIQQKEQELASRNNNTIAS